MTIVCPNLSGESSPLTKSKPRAKWAGKRSKNGRLLEEAAAAGFAVLLTVDQNIRYQQNLTRRPIAVVVMIADGITVEDLRPLVPAI